MSRLTESRAIDVDSVVNELYAALDRRIAASPYGVCTLDLTESFITLALAQSCGKCVPCRIGLSQLKSLYTAILDGKGSLETLETIKSTAKAIAASADCAIGFEAANSILTTLVAFSEDIESHISKKGCTAGFKRPVPCISGCPAHVDVPAYTALVAEGKYADAVKVIRNDNPFVAVCGLVCEHPCEDNCRRNMLDESINIRGVKRFAIENSGEVALLKPQAATGKTVAVIGGGPSGVTAAYYLARMGHDVTLYEARKQLGGMLRYGIPEYRLPREILAHEIETLLSMGIDVKLGVDPLKDKRIDAFSSDYDAVFLSVGAQLGMKMKIEGEDANGVMSAVELLGIYGDEQKYDFSNQVVVVVGGGNVAIDVARTAIRSGAAKVIIAYRRSRADMPAQDFEIDSAVEEGVEIIEFAKPARVEVNDGKVGGLWIKPQMCAAIIDGRPVSVDADSPEVLIEADKVIAAIGQAIDSHGCEDLGIVDKCGRVITNDACEINIGIKGIFAGGECVTGPATAIKAIAAGKTAAINIDRYFGYNHQIKTTVETPKPKLGNILYTGRQNMVERPSNERKQDFKQAELSLTKQKVECEASRCLRCDHFGFGAIREGREQL